MEKKKTSLYSLSKYPNLEIILDSQLASAGAHQAKVLERCEKNKKYIKSQASSLKIVSAIVILFVPIMLVVVFFGLLNDVDFSSFSPESQLFVYSLFLSVFFVLLLIYVFLFGLFTTSSLMSGNAFKWMQTLPLSKTELRKLGFMTLFRNLNLVTIIMILSFPITLLIITQNPIAFLLSLVSTFLLTMFSISMLIIVGEKFSHLFSEQFKKSRRATILRFISLFSYFIIAFSSGFIMSIAFIFIESATEFLSTSGISEMVLIILSIIPFPFAPGFLIGLTLVPEQIPVSLWSSTISGIVIFALLIFVMYKLAIRSLKNVTSPEFAYLKQKPEKDEQIKEIELKIEPKSPIRAYIKKDLVASTRDYQSLIFILMPIVYPLILIFSMGGLITESISSSLSIMILWAIIMVFNLIIPILLVGGLLNLEESGSSIMASLPVVPREQAKGKISLMLIIHSLSLILLTIVLTIQSQSIYVLILLLSSLPLIWTFLLLMFEMKIYLFGKMKYRYVLEEVNRRHKIWKWIGMISAEVGLFLFILIIGSLIFISFDILYAIIGILLLGFFTLSITLFALYRMFPSKEQSPKYETGSFLRNKPIIGALTMLLLYFGFPFIGSFFEGFLFIPWIYNLPYITRLFIIFLYIQAIIALLLLFIVPKGLKLPIKTKLFKEYIDEVKIAKFKPVGRTILMGLGTFIIYGVIVYVGAIILGTYPFDPEILFGTPNPLGWFIWIFALQPGIWEELTFRGIAIPMLLKRYSQKTAIIISSVVFGIAHSFNIITGGAPLYVLFQVIYTFFLGLVFGYLFIKTNSLIPCIILHYLVDTIGIALITPVIINLSLQIVYLVVYLVVFVGVLPTVFSLIFIKIFSKK